MCGKNLKTQFYMTQLKSRLSFKLLPEFIFDHVNAESQFHFLYRSMLNFIHPHLPGRDSHKLEVLCKAPINNCKSYGQYIIKTLEHWCVLPCCVLLALPFQFWFRLWLLCKGVFIIYVRGGGNNQGRLVTFVLPGRGRVCIALVGDL